jgi:hypothetical protein
MHMMHDGGRVCSGSRDGIVVIAHDAAWWFVQHDQYFQNAGWLSV